MQSHPVALYSLRSYALGQSHPVALYSLRSFLGLCSYYRRFVHSFADLARPLHQLLEKGQAFEWTPDAAQAFQQLKERLTQTPILGYPLPEEPFILDTDASGYATGAVLSLSLIHI